MATPVRFLVADDHATHRRLVWRVIQEEFGAEARIVTAVDGLEAMAVLSGNTVDVVVTDLHMPGANGLEVARAARSATPPVPVVLLTGDPAAVDLRDVIEVGVFALLSKPCDVDHLASVLRRAVHTEATRLEPALGPG